jgi:regulatory protein
VQQGLWLKHIDDDIQDRVLGEVDDSEYLAVLRPLLKQKVRSIRTENDYERTQKLVRFALGRGFTFDIIRQCLNVDDDMNTEDDED